MELVIGLVLLAGIALWLFSRAGTGHAQKSEPASSVSVVTEVDSPAETEIPNCGDVVATDGGGWIINPKSPFPLTLVGTDRESAEKVRSLLDSLYSDGGREAHNELVGVVARSNLRCKEIEDYCEKYRPKFEGTIESLKRSSSEWIEASELDRMDLLQEFRQEALRSLEMLPCDRVDEFPTLPLFEDQPADLTVDDALIDRYGFDLVTFYFRYADKLEKVHVVAADHWARKKFEALVEAGLARRGKSIPMEALLATLRLKDMNEFVIDPAVKRFTRKANAIEYLASQPNTLDKLSKMVSFRELFQLVPFPGEFADLDLDAVAKSWRYSEAVSSIIADTYEGGLNSLQQSEFVTDISSDIIGWKLSINEEHAPPYCRKVAERINKTKAIPKMPAHIGCNCRVYPNYRDMA